MAKRSISEHLRASVPEFQQNRRELDGFLDAAGTFLERIKQDIVGVSKSKDYQAAKDGDIVRRNSEVGMTMPRGLSMGIHRRVKRDVPQINLKLGTADDIRVSMGLSGADADILQAWLPNPLDMKQGYMKDVETGIRTAYDPDHYVYSHFLYGEEVVTPNGVFFEGYRYQDTFNEEKIGPIPIEGETYDVVPDNTNFVGKTPYAVVRFKDSDFNLADMVFTDPETGEVYARTAQEESALVDELIKYFTRIGRRPTTLKIIIVVSVQILEDDVKVVDEFEQTLDGGTISHDIAVDQDFVNVDPIDSDIEFVVKLEPMADMEDSVGVDVYEDFAHEQNSSNEEEEGAIDASIRSTLGQTYIMDLPTIDWSVGGDQLVGFGVMAPNMLYSPADVGTEVAEAVMISSVIGTTSSIRLPIEGGSTGKYPVCGGMEISLTAPDYTVLYGYDAAGTRNSITVLQSGEQYQTEFHDFSYYHIEFESSSEAIVMTTVFPTMVFAE